MKVIEIDTSVILIRPNTPVTFADYAEPSIKIPFPK